MKARRRGFGSHVLWRRLRGLTLRPPEVKPAAPCTCGASRAARLADTSASAQQRKVAVCACLPCPTTSRGMHSARRTAAIHASLVSGLF